MKVLPGYKRVIQRIAFDNLYVHQYPAEELRKMVAYSTGDMLANALLTQDVDTTKPIFVDGSQKVHALGRADFAAFDNDLTEVKIELHYFPRQPGLAELARSAGATESDTEIDLLTERPLGLDG
jgi:hypothetical protein